MKKSTLVFISLLLMSCMQPLDKKSSTQNYVLKGTINGEFDDYIKIKYDDTVDSTEVVNNAFQFEGQLSSPTEFKFYFDSLNTSKSFYLENDTLLFDITLDESKLEENLFKEHEVRHLSGGESQNLKAYITDSLASMPRSKMNRNLILNRLDSLIKKYPNHDLLGKTLSEMSMKQTLLYNDIRSLISKLDVDELNSEDVNILEKYQQKRRTYQIGSQIPSFELTTITGETIDLKSEFSTYNLVQFWNSWCEKCKQDQNELKETYQNFKFKGFEIISVSLDTSREDWISAVAEHTLPWTSLRAKSGFTGEIATELGIVDLPQYYLLDKTGRIIEINLSHKELKVILSALLN